MSKLGTLKKLQFLSKTKDRNREKFIKNLHKSLEQISDKTVKTWIKELKNAQLYRD